MEPSGLYSGITNGLPILFQLTSASAIGILGATVMPHGLFLGSHLATQDRVNISAIAEPSELPTPPGLPIGRRLSLKYMYRKFFVFGRVDSLEGDMLKASIPHGERENNSLVFIKAHYIHGLWDIILSLLGFAVAINSAWAFSLFIHVFV